MMPEAWANIRSMARWVLPVFVGPRTARTVRDALITSNVGSQARKGKKNRSLTGNPLGHDLRHPAGEAGRIRQRLAFQDPGLVQQ